MGGQQAREVGEAQLPPGLWRVAAASHTCRRRQQQQEADRFWLSCLGSRQESVKRLYDLISLESLVQNLLGKILHMWLKTDPEALILSGSVPLAKYLVQVDSLCLSDSGGELAWTSPHPETHSGFRQAGGPMRYRRGPA